MAAITGAVAAAWQALAHRFLATPAAPAPPQTHLAPASPFPPPPLPPALLQGHFIISPRIKFEVPVRILGGLMALGYEIGSIMRRTSEVFSDSQ